MKKLIGISVVTILSSLFVMGALIRHLQQLQVQAQV